MCVNGTSLRAAVALHERMQPGAVFLIEGTADANANALRNGGGETVELKKLELADVAPAEAEPASEPAARRRRLRRGHLDHGRQVARDLRASSSRCCR